MSFSHPSVTEDQAETPTAEKPAAADLIKQAAGGSGAAFGDLYKMYMDRIYRYLYYQVKDKMTAEDMTEEAFLKMWRGLPRFRGDERAFTAWLYRIAHNCLIDGCRAKRRELPLDDDSLAAIEGPEDTNANLFAECDLPKLLSGLPALQKQIIILKFIEGMENDEIAAITGKSQGAIRISQMRALSNLRRKLNEEARTSG